MNQDLMEYIKNSRKAGVQEYFIRQALITAGWDRNTIDDAMDSPDGWPSEKRVDFT